MKINYREQRSPVVHPGLVGLNFVHLTDVVPKDARGADQHAHRASVEVVSTLEGKLVAAGEGIDDCAQAGLSESFGAEAAGLHH